MFKYDTFTGKYVIDEDALVEDMNRVRMKLEEVTIIMHKTPYEELLEFAKETATQKVHEKGYFTPVDLAMWLAFTEEAANKAYNRAFGRNYKIVTSNPSVWKNTIEFVFEELRKIADEDIITVDKVMQAYKKGRSKALKTLLNEEKEKRTMKRQEMIETATENIHKILDRSYVMTPKSAVLAFTKAGFTCQDSAYDAIVNEVIILPDDMGDEVVDRAAELFCKSFLERNACFTEIVKVDHVRELLDDAIVQAKHESNKVEPLLNVKMALDSRIVIFTDFGKELDANVCWAFCLDKDEYNARKESCLTNGAFTHHSDFTQEEWKEVVDEMINELGKICDTFGSYLVDYVIINLEVAIRSMRIKKAKAYFHEGEFCAYSHHIIKAFAFDEAIQDDIIVKEYVRRFEEFGLENRIASYEAVVVPALSTIEATKDISYTGVFMVFLDALENAEADKKPDGIYVSVTEEWFVDERRINKSYISVTAEIDKKDIEEVLVKYGYSKTFGTDDWEALTIYAAGEICVRKKTKVTLSERYCEMYPYSWSSHYASPFSTFGVGPDNITISDVFNIIERNYRIRSYNKVDGNCWCLLAKGEDDFPVIVLDELQSYESALKVQEKVFVIGEETMILPTEVAEAEGFFFGIDACHQLLKKMLETIK